jgi:Rhodopirellula transposase DDE domain
MAWNGRPLVSYEAVVNLIGHTRTRSGLKVKAVLDTRPYETGQTVPSENFYAVRLKAHAFHPDWNYTVLPQTG